VNEEPVAWHDAVNDDPSWVVVAWIGAAKDDPADRFVAVNDAPVALDAFGADILDDDVVGVGLSKS